MLLHRDPRPSLSLFAGHFHVTSITGLEKNDVDTHVEMRDEVGTCTTWRHRIDTLRNTARLDDEGVALTLLSVCERPLSDRCGPSFDHPPRAVVKVSSWPT